jgi:hypothetical protein
MKQLDAELAAIDALAQPIRVWRDKNIAHTDVAAALGYLELEDVSTETVDSIIEKIGAFFVRVQLSQHPDVYQDPIATRYRRSANRLLDSYALGLRLPRPGESTAPTTKASGF